MPCGYVDTTGNAGQTHTNWCDATFVPPFSDNNEYHENHMDLCSAFTNASPCGEYYVDDVACTHDQPYSNWNNHPTVNFYDIPFYNWPNHSNQAWQNHPFSNTQGHDDTWCDTSGHGHQNWPDFNQCNGPVRYPDCSFIDYYSDYTFCETSQTPGHPDAFQETIFDNWPNNIYDPHQNTPFYDFQNQIFTTHIDFCDHSDIYSKEGI